MKKDKVILFIISIVLGILIGFQFNTVDSVREVSSFYGKGSKKLISEIKKMDKEKEYLEEEIKQRSKVLDKYEKDIMDKDKSTKPLMKDLEKYKMMLGYQEVQGQGILIEIDVLYDDPLFLYDEQVLVGNKELLTFIVNILKMAGAEAISINDLRITGHTEIEVAGSHFEINGISTNIPFSIKVIGNQDDLFRAMKNLIDDEYFDIKITKKDNITIPKSNKIVKFKYAEPILEGNK